MRQVMPHRNNIELRRTKSKRYFSIRWKNQFPSWDCRDEAPASRRRLAGEIAVGTGIYMIFSGSDGGRVSTKGYTRYADFAGARA
jgi:hypothetical protein